MKKLIITLVSVAIAAGVQAAAVDWSMTINAATSGGISADKVGNYMVYMFDGADAAWTAAFTGSKLDLTKSLDSAGFSVNGIKFVTGDQSLSTTAASVTYKMILVDTANDKWAIVKEGTIASYDPESSSGTQQSGSTTGARVLGTASSGNLAWTAGTVSVPEPTSGLLMLLGMAGLALRRRRA